MIVSYLRRILHYSRGYRDNTINSLNNECSMFISSTGAYELAKDGYALRKCYRYREALVCFRSVLDIRLVHLYTEPRSSTLDVATAHINIAITLGEINRQEDTDDKTLSRAEIASNLLKAAIIHRDTLGEASDVTEETWTLFETVPLW